MTRLDLSITINEADILNRALAQFIGTQLNNSDVYKRMKDITPALHARMDFEQATLLRARINKLIHTEDHNEQKGNSSSES